MRTRTLSYRWGGLLLAVLICVSGAAMAGERSTGQVIDDALITTKVKASFAADPQVSALAINVDTSNGVVTLTGVVDGEPERQRAIQLAQGTEGVRRVDANNLRVKH
jgi:hyperosmotically inducible protein